MSEKLRIGVINYANVFPIFHALESECDCGGYEFVEGYPSELNGMLREGRLDVSISSSVEYLRHKGDYGFIGGHSISSDGPVESIILFSRVPIDSLDSRTVFVTHQSETSPVLLDIILRKFYRAAVTLETATSPVGEAIAAHPAYLAIGNDALMLAHKAEKVQGAKPGEFELVRIGKDVFYIYDLGNLWRLHTGLPFVFALWIARKKSLEEKRRLFEMFGKDLDKAKSFALRHLPMTAEASDLKDILGADRLVSYWGAISYDLGERHMKGLELFGKYASELGLL